MHPADIRVTISCLPRGAVPLHTDAAGTAPPDAFGPFRVLHQIGAGTLGPVFRAYDAQQDRLVTVKQFKLELRPERLHQLVGEFERVIAAELTHPFIAAPIATGTDGITVYLARDFVAADSLDVAVRDARPARPQETRRGGGAARRLRRRRGLARRRGTCAARPAPQRDHSCGRTCGVGSGQ